MYMNWHMHILKFIKPSHKETIRLTTLPIASHHAFFKVGMSIVYLLKYNYTNLILLSSAP